MNYPRNKTPHISVIIPVFNRASTIERAIISVLKQSYKYYELIVVDDGSTDLTPSILKKYNSRIKVITLKQNCGVSHARNEGINASTGKYIALLDSDDEWKKRFLETQVNYFNLHPQIKILQTDEIWIRNGKRINQMKIHLKKEGYIFNICLARCMISPSAVTIKKEIFDSCGLFDTDYPACEDYELWLRIASRYPVGLLPERLMIKYGGHEDQLSRTVLFLDRYRIQALDKLLTLNWFNERQTPLATDMLLRKARIYHQGCLRHDKSKNAEKIAAIIQKYEK